MIRLFLVFAFVFSLSNGPVLAAGHGEHGKPELEVIAEFDLRPGNPAVGLDGAIYMSMHPFDGPKHKIMRVTADGVAKPYPTAEMSASFAAVIGVWMADNGVLWVLDMGGDGISPSLIGWDIVADELVSKFDIPESMRVGNSFLQDLVVDVTRNRAYLADMSRGDMLGDSKPAIIVVNLDNGQMRRVLEGDIVFQPTGHQKAEGKTMQLTKDDGSRHDLALGLNPIGLDGRAEYVYFSTIASGPVYRVPSSLLGDFSASEADIKAAIEDMGDKPTSDGIAVRGETVFITNVEESRMTALTGGKLKTISDDPRLIWPDGVAVTPGGDLIVTVNQLNRAAPFNGGTEGAEKPHLLVRIPGGAK